MTTTPSTKPKTIADVVRLLVTQAIQNGEARHEFRGVTYGARVTTDEDGKKSGEVWKVVRGQRACVGDAVNRAGYETFATGVISFGSSGSDLYNHISFNDDGTPVAYGTWRH